MNYLQLLSACKITQITQHRIEKKTEFNVDVYTVYRKQ